MSYNIGRVRQTPRGTPAMAEPAGLKPRLHKRRVAAHADQRGLGHP
jgi:hypothetical protein